MCFRKKDAEFVAVTICILVGMATIFLGVCWALGTSVSWILNHVTVTIH